MANKSFTSLSQLEAYLMDKINRSLNTNVAEQVKEEIKTAVDEKIYQSGDPVIYKRRNLTNGSLGDPNEMKHIVEGNTLIVTDEAKPKLPWDRDLTEAMVHGYGSESEWYNVPRDFLETARENMKSNKSHVSALREGLQKQGMEVV